MTQIFDGKAAAEEIEEVLVKQVEELNEQEVNPKLVSIIVGDDPSSKLYLSLKKAAASSVGADLEIMGFENGYTIKDIIKLIQDLNIDETVDGIMIQLPLPDKFNKKDRNQIISSINPEKDVDGMKDDSPFLAPVVKAILIALKEASEHLPNDREAEVVVIGSKGFVGSKVVRVFNDMGYKTEGVDKNTKNWKKKVKKADVVISATGEEKLINGDLIKKGSVVIDVGSPKPDVDRESVKDKAAFLSPVPGGVGPLTVVVLIENLLQVAAEKAA